MNTGPRVPGPTEEELRGAVRIALTKGLVALVSPEDAEDISRYKWYANQTRPGRFYATRHRRLSDPPGTPSVVMMHRQIMGLITAPRTVLVDHIEPFDHGGLVNIRSNLRLCDHRKNLFNAVKRRGCTSSFKGVYWSSKARKWRALIRAEGRGRHLGCFTDETEAALAYDWAAREHFGPFARPNFPENMRAA